MILRRLAAALGAGAVAGMAGTLAITASQTIEMKLRGRKASPTPAKAVEKVLRIKPESERAESVLGQLVHVDYGTSWGFFLPVLSAFGLRGLGATLLHWGAIQGTAMVMLPGLKVVPPVKEWGRKEISVEMFHHLVYAAAAGWAFRHARRRPLFSS